MSEQVTASPSQDRADSTADSIHPSGPQKTLEDQPVAGPNAPHSVPLRSEHLGGSQGALSSCASSPRSTRQEPSIHPGQAGQTVAVEPAHFTGHDRISVDLTDKILVQVHNLRTSQAHLRNMVSRQQADIDRLRVSLERFVARLLDLELMVNLRQA